jgi:hypothetical protein
MQEFYSRLSTSAHTASFSFSEQWLQLRPALRVITLHVLCEFVVATSAHHSGQATRLSIRIEAPRNVAHHLLPLHVQSRHPVDAVFPVLWHDVPGLALHVEIPVNKPRHNLRSVRRGVYLGTHAWQRREEMKVGSGEAHVAA